MSEQILQTEYSEVMQKSYIDYAMSVITARALPDARDGLKPVQRRVLYAMEELHLDHDKPHRKSARIVGDTMGKYHPHGDSSIYEALVVMSQDFKKGMPLVDGHGNFGSIEGDGAAAMRYTEARLQKFTEDAYLSDLDKNVIDFIPNFDETEKEPSVLPVRIPNLLVNGADGIAVGMTTSIPPHNLGEVIDGMIAYMDRPTISNRELMEYVPGPDFPTGGLIVNKSELGEIYESGSGKLKVRGKVCFEPAKKRSEKDKLVITEIPYTMVGAGIGKFISDVCALAEARKLPEVTDISNESSKEGIRIALELKKDADIEKIKNILYKKTKLEDTFGVNMLAIANNRPETLSLKGIYEYCLDFQYEIYTRKYETLLNKALEQKEIKEGLIRACDMIDLIIEIIRGSHDLKQVKACLTSGLTEGIKFKGKESEIYASQLNFTERQAQAIVELRLYKLIGLEIEALEKDYHDLVEKISEYEEILSNRKAMKKVIKKELNQIKKEYARERRTQIIDAAAPVVIEEKIEEAEVAFVMDRFGYAKTLDIASYERNLEVIKEEYKYVFTCMNTDKICVFTDKGNLHLIKVLDFPQKKFREKGVPIDNVGNYSSANESIVAIYPLWDVKSHYLLFATKHGMIKRVFGDEFDVAKRTVLASKVGEKDEIVAVYLTAMRGDQTPSMELSVEELGERVLLSGGSEEDFYMGDDEQLNLFPEEIMGEELLGEDSNEVVIFETKNGYMLRFPISEVPEKKKNALGVRGIKLTEGDEVRVCYLIDAMESKIISYKGKDLNLRKLKTAKRDGRGSKPKI